MPHPLDTQDMESVIRGFPRQFRAGIQAADEALQAAKDKGTLPPGPFGGVLLAGMGGSWMPGALARDAKLARVPILIHRNYDLPDPIHLQDPLVIASTFSGNTEETLSAYEGARDRPLPVVGVTCGGKLGDLCRDDGKLWVPIPADPPNMQPRCATGYTVGILTRLLEELDLAQAGAVAALWGLEDSLQAFVEPARKEAKRLLPNLLQATPVIYSSPTYATVARIFKIKINENSKTAAFWNVFPELNHNEMVGWTKPQGPFRVIYLRDPEDDARVLKRMDLSKELFSEHGLSVVEVPIEGESLLEKMFRTLQIADWASYELALELGEDPSPVEMIETFKGRMA
jgi:glucose/mannose-6-phosphate isomerase